MVKQALSKSRYTKIIDNKTLQTNIICMCHIHIVLCNYCMVLTLEMETGGMI